MSEPAYRHKLYVLEEGALTALANSDEFVKEFPFLKGLRAVSKNKGGGCSSCSSPAPQRATVFSAAKMTIAHMGQDAKRKLKQMLSAKHVRVVYLQGNKPVQLTF